MSLKSANLNYLYLMILGFCLLLFFALVKVDGQDFKPDLSTQFTETEDAQISISAGDVMDANYFIWNEPTYDSYKIIKDSSRVDTTISLAIAVKKETPNIWYNWNEPADPTYEILWVVERKVFKYDSLYTFALDDSTDHLTEIKRSLMFSDKSEFAVEHNAEALELYDLWLSEPVVLPPPPVMIDVTADGVTFIDATAIMEWQTTIESFEADTIKAKVFIDTDKKTLWQWLKGLFQ